MASYRVTMHYTLRDVDGNSIVVGWSIGSQVDTVTAAQIATSNAAINTVLAPLTNAKVVQRSAVILLDEAQGVGVDAEFPLISQQARLHFNNAQGGRASFTIPAPVESDFRAPPSDDIVDPTNAAMAAFITAYESHATDPGGNPLNLFQGGALKSRNRSRRRSIHS